MQRCCQRASAHQARGVPRASLRLGVAACVATARRIEKNCPACPAGWDSDCIVAWQMALPLSYFIVLCTACNSRNSAQFGTFIGSIYFFDRQCDRTVTEPHLPVTAAAPTPAYEPSLGPPAPCSGRARARSPLCAMRHVRSRASHSSISCEHTARRAAGSVRGSNCYGCACACSDPP